MADDLTLMAVHAHPDDESFSFAGTAMKLLERGHEAGLVTLTRGDKGRWYGKRPLYSWDSRLHRSRREMLLPTFRS